MATGLISYPNNRRVWKSLIVSKFNGVEVKLHTDIKMGETNKTESFLAVNPFHQVPTLIVESGKGVFESNSIARYYARLGEKKHPLLGGNILENSRVDSYLDAVIALESVVGPWGYKVDKASWSKSWPKSFVDNCKDRTKENLRGFNYQLGISKFLVGDSITLADIAFFCSSFYAFNHLLGAEFRKEIPHAVAHFEKLAALDEFKSVYGGTYKFPDTEPEVEYE